MQDQAEIKEQQPAPPIGEQGPAGANAKPVKARAESPVEREFDFNDFESNTSEREFKLPGWKPIKVHVRKSALHNEDLAAYNRAMQSLPKNITSRGRLQAKKFELEQEQLRLGIVDFTEDVDEATLSPEEIENRANYKEIKAEIAELDKQVAEALKLPQSSDEIRVDMIVLPMVESWEARRGGVIVPLERKVLLSKSGLPVDFLEMFADWLIEIAREDIVQVKQETHAQRKRKRR